jgi:hypothetical protein
MLQEKSMYEPMNVEAFEEWELFTQEEKEIYAGCVAALKEEGVLTARAERDAAAAILQHRDRVLFPDKQLHWCLKQHKKYRSEGHSCEEAERRTLQDLERLRLKKIDEEKEAKLPYQKNSPTSKAAAQVAQSGAKTLREQVYQTIVNAGAEGHTDFELVAKLNIPLQTVIPRRRELVLDVRVKDSGKTRQSPSDRAATVWVAI